MTDHEKVNRWPGVNRQPKTDLIIIILTKQTSQTKQKNGPKHKETEETAQMMILEKNNECSAKKSEKCLF